MKTATVTWLFVGLITLCGLLLRLQNLNDKSLWSDEICTVATALGNSVDSIALQHFDPPSPQSTQFYKAKAFTSHGMGNWGKTVQVLQSNIHPPLYFWLMNPSIHLWGTSPAALRLLAVLLGVLCIPMLFILGRRLAGAEVGLLAASIMAFSGYHIAHSQDARQYTLLTLLALSTAWLTLKLLSQSQRRYGVWILWSVLSVMGLYTQYLYGLFLGFLILYSVFQKNTDKRFLAELAGAVILVGILFLPWLPVFLKQLAFIKLEGHYTNGLWRPLQLPYVLWRTITDFIAPQDMLLKVGLSVLWLGQLLMGLLQKKMKPLAPLIVFILFWIGTIICGQIALDLIKQSHTLTIRRYTLLVAPAVYLLLAFSIFQVLKPLVQKWLKSVLIGILMWLMLNNAFAVIHGRVLRSDHFKEGAEWVNQQWKSGDLLLTHQSGSIAVGFAYYLKPEIVMLGVSNPSEQTLNESIIPAMKRHSRVWVLYSHSKKTIQRQLEASLIAQGFQLIKKQKFPGVQGALYSQAKH